MPEEGVVEFSVHNHGLKHGTLPDHKLYGPVDHTHQRPVVMVVVVASLVAVIREKKDHDII